MMRLVAIMLVVLAVAGCTHHHSRPTWQQFNRQARQEQVREIRPIVTSLCERGHGVPDLAALCREWHLPLR